MDYLVLGNKGFASNLNGKGSAKLRKAEENMLKGLPVQTISEDFFMEYVSSAMA